MITNGYKKNKQDVLNIYEEFEKIMVENQKKVNKSIIKQVESIRKEQFSLMVTGEAKSGKSTFINAYLGDEVLPMDVQQCTSSIIKISYGKEYELIATNAKGEKIKIQTPKEIHEFLVNHGAVRDEYRHIPVTTINNELLIKCKGRSIRKETLEEFLIRVKNDNINKLPEVEYNSLIKKYIDENINKWGSIITEIIIKYPLSESMKGIELIDSPGVNASGDIGAISEKYIENANAIIFVKSIVGQAIESISFTNFLKCQSLNRHKATMFLVLTGTSNMNKMEIATLKKQAVSVYGKIISEDKIICVDSKIELFLNICIKLGREDIIDEYFSKLKKENKSFAPARLCWLDTEKSFQEFKDEMSKLSNFSKVNEVIEKFAHKANYILLSSFLDNLNTEYIKYKSILENQIKIMKESTDDPEKLQLKITRKIEEIQVIYNKMNESINKIETKYANTEGIIDNTAEELEKEYKRKLENFNQLVPSEISDETFEKLESITFLYIDKVKEIRNDLGYKIIEDCNNKLIQIANVRDEIPVEAFNSNFTNSDFEDINNEAYKKSNKVKEIEEGLTFKKVSEKVIYYRAEHLRITIKNISERLEEIVDSMKDNLLDYLISCLEKYRQKLTENKDELEKEYNILLEKKKTAEFIQKTIEEYDNKINSILENTSQLEFLKKGIENYVN